MYIALPANVPPFESWSFSDYLCDDGQNCHFFMVTVFICKMKCSYQMTPSLSSRFVILWTFNKLSN